MVLKMFPGEEGKALLDRINAIKSQTLKKTKSSNFNTEPRSFYNQLGDETVKSKADKTPFTEEKLVGTNAEFNLDTKNDIRNLNEKEKSDEKMIENRRKSNLDKLEKKILNQSNYLLIQ